MTFKELEKLLISHGWRYKNSKGSHNYYIHHSLPGKITIPKHRRRCEKGYFKFHIKTSKFKIKL